MTAVNETAGETAGAISAEAKVEAAEHRRVCANCEAPAPRRYCPECGQKTHLHTRLSHLLEEFAEGIAHFDGRFWRTLPLLVARPGRLSREWREGRRTRYVPPLHLFLFAVFAFFFVQSIDLPHEDAEDEPPARSGVTRIEPPPERELGPLGKRADALADWLESTTSPLDGSDAKYYEYKAETLFYKAAPGLAPVSIGILWLLLLGRRRLSLYDHTVVSLYGLSTLTLALTIGLTVAHFTGRWLWYPFWGLMFAHATAHLHGAYGLSWIGAGLRAVGLGALTAVLFFIFFVLLLALAVSG